MYLLEFSPIEYWMLTVKDRKADIKRARSEISAVSIKLISMFTPGKIICKIINIYKFLAILTESCCDIEKMIYYTKMW